ncbi:ATP-binding protein [Silvibacterium acidisoli]|uniref:ATP-binding protein n=1 Tax=Acidobacteriaceae bacterium ZG23-2 TaxID=2883246 RepID=UPI00406C0E68
MGSTEATIGTSGQDLAVRARRALVEASSALLSGNESTFQPASVLHYARLLMAADGYAVWQDLGDRRLWQLLACHGITNTHEGEWSFHILRNDAELLVVEDVTAEPAVAERLEWYAAEGIRSLLMVGLEMGKDAATGALFGFRGSIAFYFREPHIFTPEELDNARVLGNLAASALRMAALREGEQRERARLALLAEAGVVLSSSLDYRKTLDSLVRMAVSQFADGCTVSILEGENLPAVAVAHKDPAREREIREFTNTYPQRLHDGSGSAIVAETGLPRLRALMSDEYLVSTARSAEHLRMLRQLGISSQILVPLKTHRHTLGVMRLTRGVESAPYNEDDLKFAEELARRASAAIENATLYGELSLSESRYRSLTEATSALAYTIDSSGRFTEPQPAWAAYTGQAWEQHRDYGWAEALHPDDRQRMLNDLLWSMGDICTHTHGARVWHAASKTYRHCTVRAVPMKDESGCVREWVGIIVDVHDQQLAEEKLRRTEQLATAGRMAATVAHEINNPLECVTNLVYLSQQSTELDEATRGYLAMASDEMQRVAQIVRQTLGFYRENASPQPADIGEIALEVKQLYRRNAMAKMLNLTAEIESNITACVVPGEIRQVITNLIANAIDASETGGEIHIEAHRAENKIVVRILDQGPGISDENFGHLFEPFFTTKRDSGTGLGLWVSRGLIEKHHGKLTVASHIHPRFHGAVFTIELPYSKVC